MVGDRGIGVYFFILIILYDCDIYVGESKPTYSSVTHLSIINILHCHFPSYYTLPLFWGLVFSWDPLGTFVYIDRALPARLYFVFLSWYVWCMIGMDLA